MNRCYSFLIKYAIKQTERALPDVFRVFTTGSIDFTEPPFPSITSLHISSTFVAPSIKIFAMFTRYLSENIIIPDWQAASHICRLFARQLFDDSGLVAECFMGIRFSLHRVEEEQRPDEGSFPMGHTPTHGHFL